MHMSNKTPVAGAAEDRPRPRVKDTLMALPWIAPALVLIFGVVLFPAGVMFYNSTRDISQSGVDRGGVGMANYAEVFGFAYFWPIFFRTIWWVVAVVFFTVIISLALAQILNKAFPGRKLEIGRASCRGRGAAWGERGGCEGRRL